MAIFNSYVKLPEGTTLYPYRPHDFDFAIPLALYHWGIRYWYAHKEDFKKSKKNVIICLDMVSRPCFQSSARLVMGQSLPLLQQALQQQAVPVPGDPGLWEHHLAVLETTIQDASETVFCHEIDVNMMSTCSLWFTQINGYLPWWTSMIN